MNLTSHFWFWTPQYSEGLDRCSEWLWRNEVLKSSTRRRALAPSFQPLFLVVLIVKGEICSLLLTVCASLLYGNWVISSESRPLILMVMCFFFLSFLFFFFFPGKQSIVITLGLNKPVFLRNPNKILCLEAFAHILANSKNIPQLKNEFSF